MENYFEVWENLLEKLNKEKLAIYRIKDCGLFGDSYLFFAPQETKDIYNYTREKYTQGPIKILLDNSSSSIQKFDNPLEREYLSLKNLQTLISENFVLVRTNKPPNYGRAPKQLPVSETMPNLKEDKWQTRKEKENNNSIKKS